MSHSRRPGLEGTEIWIVAKGLQEAFEKAVGWEKPRRLLLTFKAEKLHNQNARHPFIDRNSLIMLGEHVTLDAGTGAVHTAPGHGVDDYKIGSRYGLPIFAPVDDKGRYNADFPPMQGQFVFKCNEPVIALLTRVGPPRRTHGYSAQLSALLALQLSRDFSSDSSMVHRNGNSRATREKCRRSAQAGRKLDQAK